AFGVSSQLRWDSWQEESSPCGLRERSRCSTKGGAACFSEARPTDRTSIPLSQKTTKVEANTPSCSRLASCDQVRLPRTRMYVLAPVFRSQLRLTPHVGVPPGAW